MDEIIESIFRGLLSALRFIVWEFVFLIVLFNIGRVILLLITFGRYPKSKHIEKDSEKIALFGFLFIFIAWLTLAVYNNVTL